MPTKSKSDLVKEATQAYSDLNTFYVVISIMEGGHLHSPSYAAAQRIIKICQAEGAKLLRTYDRAREGAIR